MSGDRRFEILDRSEHTSFEALPGEFGKEALDGIEPGARGRREVERPLRMLGKPGQHLGVFVGGVVVENGMDHLAGRDGPLDGVDEADELLMAMAGHAAADDLAFEDAEGGDPSADSGASWCRCACSHGSWSRTGPASAASPALRWSAWIWLWDFSVLVDGQRTCSGRLVVAHPTMSRPRRARRPSTKCRSSWVGR